VTQGHQRDLARSQEIEGKCFYPSISCIPKPTPDPLQRLGLKGKLAKVEAELLLVREALKMEQHKQSELRTAVGLVCNALRAIRVAPGRARCGVISGSPSSGLGPK
jgi:hypothetical protein